MSVFNEADTVQQPIVERLTANGWVYVPGAGLEREESSPFVEPVLRDALIRLNPSIAAHPERAEEVLAVLRALPLAVHDDGLVVANEKLLSWLRGRQAVQFIGEAFHEPVKLIDFEDPSRNSFVVSDEVTFGTPGHRCRFDIVLWVNGLPLVVGEAKTPVRLGVNHLDGAKDIQAIYEVQWPQFFATNAFSFATDGKTFIYGAVRRPIDEWKMWGSTQDEPTLSGWPRVKRSVDSLLAPETVLRVLHDYTAYETRARHSSAPERTKIIPRYPQFEAVEALVARVVEGKKRRGLIYHTQGSGKTLAMVFAAAKLMADLRLGNPTIVLIADRVQLVGQTYDQFRTTDMPALQAPETAAALRTALASDRRGLIFATVHKFNGAGLLNTRNNIIVLVDEAHRSQEGTLGAQLRDALPAARFFAFTGTPIAEVDRNTYRLFGDPGDPGHVMHTYDSDRAIADGVVVPVHVSPRVVRFHLDKGALDKAFAELVAEEGLSEDERELVTKKATAVSTFFSNPERIAKVCEDILEHFYTRVDPLGMKAQIVVADRDLCVKYQAKLRELLDARAARTGAPADECTVVMSVQSKDPVDWQQYARSETDEGVLLDRFRTYGDRLKFLIVTAKLGTGFDAPIEGVMYLDKPLKKHTLFQTITRTNRTWRNPVTGQEKKYGLIVDYVGLGTAFAEAMRPADPNTPLRQIETSGLLDVFEAEISALLARFVGINRADPSYETLHDAENRVPVGEHRNSFLVAYELISGIWEACYPEPDLELRKDDYRFLSQVYAAVAPSANTLLLERVGAKTLKLVHSYMLGTEVTKAGFESVVADATTIANLAKRETAAQDAEQVTKSSEEVLDTLVQRLQRRLAGENGGHVVYRTLAERLERLRKAALGRAEESVDYLRELLVLARDLTVAEKAEDEHGAAGLDLIDPNVGALTQIFNECAPKDAPVMIGEVVREIDVIVKEVRYDGWSATQRGDRLVRVEVRKILAKHKLPTTGDLFDRAYAYIAEHY